MGYPSKTGEYSLFKPSGTCGFWQTRVCRYGKWAAIMGIAVCFVFFAGCSDRGANPSEEPWFEILEVEINSNPVMTEDTTLFTVLTDDSVEASYQFAWHLQQPDDVTKDTLTPTNTLTWIAPDHDGEYTHTVQVENESGEELSGEYSFSVNVENPSLFNRWDLVEIRYDNGDTLRPASGEPYWFELSEDSVFAEGAYHPSLVGQSYCNPCLGYFDYWEDTREIKIAFICERLVCGIATFFASTVATSYEYAFSKEHLILYFETSIEGKGHLILKPTE